MLHLSTFDHKALVLFRDAVTGIEKIPNGCIIYCGNIVHKVEEDFDTVYDMLTGQPNNVDNNGTPVFTPPLVKPTDIYPNAFSTYGEKCPVCDVTKEHMHTYDEVAGIETKK